MKRQSTINHQPSTGGRLTDRLLNVRKRRALGWAALAYAGVVLAGAFLGAEITLRSKTRRVKGVIVPVGRRGNSVFLPASAETLSRGPIGIVPLLPNKGHAVLGERKVVGTLVRREVTGERGVLPNGALAWASTFVYNGTPAQLGVAFEHTAVSTPLGDMPAWHIPPSGDAPGRADTLVIVIHGHGGQRAQALRMLPALQRTGTGSLFVTFRNAHGAPASPQGYLTLGDQEAEDVLAALHWARDAGYKRAVLYGFSMGGNIALSVLRQKHRPYPLPILGVMLDCPALDWRDTIRSQGVRVGIPAFMARHVARFVERIVTRRSGQDFDTVDQIAAAPTFDVPMILWHGTRDRTIPVGQADRLAAARPDLIEYHRVEGGKHIRVWNIDPEQYDAQLETFIARVVPEVEA
ncbi:S9 family peptidase [Deinococcus sp. 6GRE01]|uniref:alpha/beta hydrolase family protein n=1 Tax=Deinococcus sp. 6GRE01 TaxID=2745873 RepID=UPI001E580E3B|nr:alpha/beta fold hydrolase [Deinococcus sp. 6GRE01]MCD0157250.1 alpha/beta hydrolase [Deinococcus sp. 6GRE01]